MYPIKAHCKNQYELYHFYMVSIVIVVRANHHYGNELPLIPITYHMQILISETICFCLKVIVALNQLYQLLLNIS